MTGKSLASCLLVVAGAIAQTPPVRQRGEIKAQFISLGRTSTGSPTLTAAVKITNASPDYIFVLLFGPPSAVDGAGGTFDSIDSMTGVAYCLGRQNPRNPRTCVGRPMDEQFLFPVDTYTEIQPGETATLNLVLRAGYGSKGPTITLAEEIAYRVVKPDDIDQDQSVPADKKLKALHFGSLSVTGSPGATEFVTSTISFDLPK